MTTELRVLPHPPQNPTAPTLGEVQSAVLVMDGAFIDVTATVKEANKAMEDLRDTGNAYLTNYQTSMSFTIEYPATSREKRQTATRWARMLRRPALIHNGRKPRV